MENQHDLDIYSKSIEKKNMLQVSDLKVYIPDYILLKEQNIDPKDQAN